MANIDAKALVERLLEYCRCDPEQTCLFCDTIPTTLASHSAEIERLREALEDIKKAAFYYTLPKPALDIIHKRACAALAGDSHE